MRLQDRRLLTAMEDNDIYSVRQMIKLFDNYYGIKNNQLGTFYSSLTKLFQKGCIAKEEDMYYKTEKGIAKSNEIKQRDQERRRRYYGRGR